MDNYLTFESEDESFFGRAGRRTNPDDSRRTLLGRVISDMKDGCDSEQLLQRHQSVLKECCSGGGGKNPTVLHWIARRMGERLTESDLEFRAGVELAVMAMNEEPNLVAEIAQDNSKETPLHVALNSGSQLEGLVERICDCSSKDALKKAILIQNSKDENCLHIAIAHELDITRHLIKLADPKSFIAQRKNDVDGKLLKGGGNTPLHDAVDYEKYTCEEPRCAKSPRCVECESKGVYLRARRERVVGLVQELIEKCDDALTKKNSADESPYLYFLSTSAMYRKQKGTRTFQAGLQTYGTSLEDGEILTPRNEAILPKSSQKTRQLITETRAALGGKSDALLTTSTSFANFDRSKPKSRAKDQSTNQPNIGIQKTKSIQMDSTSSGVTCEGDEDSQLIADDVEDYLRESSFRIGGFEQACECFFGANEDKEGKEPILRPGHPIGADAHSCYNFLNYTATLAQVDIEVEMPMVELSGGSRKELLDQWQAHMESLKRVFDMLREQKGVKRILKLTVKDNPEMPCSDRTIESCLEGFDIRYLDWNKPDLCADVISAKAPNVAELWLYSSGKSAVLRGWSSNNGLCRMNQLTRLHLDAKQGFEDYDRYEENVDSFVKELKQDIGMARMNLYLQTRRESLPEKIRMKNKDQKAFVEWKNKITKKLEKHRSQPQTQESIETIQKRELLLQREERRSAKLNQEIMKYQGELTIVKSRLDLQRKAEDSIERTRRGELASNIVESKLDKISNIEESSVEPRLRLPKLISTREGFLAPEFKVQTPRMDPRPQQDDDIPEIELEKGDDSDVPHKRHRWLESVKAFVRRNVQEPILNNTASPRSVREVKVALIDDGVDASREDLKGTIFSLGWPKSKPTETTHPFYCSATGHGTEMATLIKLACPKIQLYVAKLSQWSDTLENRTAALGRKSTAETAANAIKWAIEQNVDIISMSWSLIRTKENHEAIHHLTEQIQKAQQRNIIMYCAAADQGLYGSDQDLMPKKAHAEYIRAIGSAKEGGLQSSFVDAHQVDYLFPGEDIENLRMGARKGSSAATALATGLAALILWCFAVHDGAGGMKKVANPVNMDKIFYTLRAHEKWIDVTRLLGSDGSATVKSVVERCERVIG